uniref:NADH-ubiquinone oxidoreductase chain 4L n=1 Tax=Metatropis longirostris TaxID=2021940 RepID=A0A343ISE8_9HEMI|nr:NADH dehydrogenase subunit 4L [Metatropis longirostris]AST10173.1 NADH dehydrogenase subunit 4L [Metatropis longirostris]
MILFKLLKLILITIIMMFLSGLTMFCSLRKHLLTAFFSLEYLIIVLFLLFFMFLMNFGYELYYILIFLIFSVCEGALGLGVLVNMIRSHGNDMLSSLSILSW